MNELLRTISPVRRSTMTDFERVAASAGENWRDLELMGKLHPALFATNAHPGMSERYSFTNTYDIVTAMMTKGYRITSIMGGTKRYDKILIRMRHETNMRLDKALGAPEIIIMDSHDGSRRLRLCLGYITFVCLNGMIAGDTVYNKSFIHLAPDLMQQVMLELEDIDSHVLDLYKRIDMMRNFTTTPMQRTLLAGAAVKLRFDGEKLKNESFVTDMRQQLLTVTRKEDNDNNLFTVLNVIQENTLRGGFSYAARRGRVMRVQDVRSADRNATINRQLWQAAEDLMLGRLAA